MSLVRPSKLSLRQIVSIPREATYSPVETEILRTGIEALDRLLDGGLPRGAVSEIVGPQSSGKTALLFRILAEATRRGESVAYIDAFDCLDPAHARKAGFDLKRTLWLRHRSLPPLQQAFKALKAADILVRSEGFGVVVLDLQPGFPSGPNPLRRVPPNVWQRLKRLLRGKPALLLLLSSKARAGSAASLVLNLEGPVVHWREPKGTSASQTSHACLLWGVSSSVRPSRGKRHGRLALHSRI